MIKEARGFGEDITEAQENARKNLGVSETEDVQYEIISQSKKKVLGIFGGAKAEVRAFVELPDAPQKIKKAQPQKKKGAKPEKAVKEPAKTEKPAKETAKTEPKIKTEVKSEFADVELLSEDKFDKNSNVARGIAYIKEILKGFGCEDVVFKAAQLENSAYISFDGNGLGAVIGRRGETLDALQYLTGLAANDGSGYFKVSLNIGDYREKREEALNILAEKVAKQVLTSGRSRALEPMNAYERRIIHTAIQQIDGVVSNSIGEGQNRRVVVYSENGDSRPPRFTNDRSRGRGRDRRNNNRRESNAVVSPSREPKKDTDIPLYGKIN